MSILDKITKNPAIKKLLVNQFKGIAKSEGLKCIVIEVLPDGEMNVTVHKEDMVTVTRESYAALIETVKLKM